MRVTDEQMGALERVYRQDGDRLWRAVLAYSGDRTVADDAVAEAFAQALRRGVELRDPERWVWVAAFKLARGELQDRDRRRSARGKEPTYEMPETTRDLLDALRTLSPRQRACVVLHHYAGYPVKEIATMLGSTNAAVKVHLSQGRKRLRVLLAPEISDD